jgi:predicted kinase
VGAVSFFLLIRGPLGSGKTTVSKRLAKALEAEYISIDAILDEPGVEEWDDEIGFYSERCFLKTSELAAARARLFLERGIPVVFDGNFYWRSQIDNLLSRLDFPNYVFTLKVPLEVCVERDSARIPPHGREATEKVFAKSTEFDAGIGVDASQSVDATVSEILGQLRPGGGARGTRPPNA